MVLKTRKRFIYRSPENIVSSLIENSMIQGIESLFEIYEANLSSTFRISLTQLPEW